MSDFNWRALEQWENRQLWRAEGHKAECNCPPCHELHAVGELADDPDFKCCWNEREKLIEKGEWCRAKPQEHGSAYMTLKICLECLHESWCPKEDHSECP